MLQAPKMDEAELSVEERQTVQLFLDNTPSVVNIANIGAASPSSCWGASHTGQPTVPGAF